MSWNYRVVHRVFNGEDCYGIHEAFYDDDWNVHSISENPVAPCGETIEELSIELHRFMHAISEPVVEYDILMKINITPVHRVKAAIIRRSASTPHDVP